MVKHKAPARKILSCQRNACAFLFLCGNLCTHAKRGYTYDRAKLAHRRCAIFCHEVTECGLRYFWHAPKSNKKRKYATMYIQNCQSLTYTVAKIKFYML